MTEEDFPATIKLVSGEEVFAIVQPHTENNKQFLLVYHPVVMKDILLPDGSSVLKIQPWLKTADDDTFLIERSNVMLLSECKDEEIILYHKKFIKERNKKGNEEVLTKEQGKIGDVKEMKKKLEEIFKEF